MAKKDRTGVLSILLGEGKLDKKKAEESDDDDEMLDEGEEETEASALDLISAIKEEDAAGIVAAIRAIAGSG